MNPTLRSAAIGVLAAFASAGPPRADAQPSLLQTGTQAWQSGDYPKAFMNLLTYRKQVSVSTFSIDYMLATSACRLPKHRKLGTTLLDELSLGHYGDFPQAQVVVKKETSTCSTASPSTRAAPLPILVPISNHPNRQQHSIIRAAGLHAVAAQPRDHNALARPF